MNETVWRKSSYSGQEGNECVEVALLDDGAAVRDSKDPRGGFFIVSEAAYSAFLAEIG
ncbi:DUF397 domain-containing protein [Amycolatopsis vancoresmycina]|uniref:DUF397 domain-containing protein n=1 Tax=Amycolatopsis vancoresmycina DSM 44592 TaxID=1292037 RepID=R1GB97_9PSEU|nr:DUF397 domain-containing protein [Amycolatopsis vancoresmycina]EOD68642.1 hypothetical protein H480_10230 [Amycolatopsis vancoresmycina DSM 44592]